MRQIGKQIEKINEEVNALAMGIMEQISQSQDEVSTVLAPIFAKAVPHSEEELQRARERRERGNPPGKGENPIGDQLTWEQILTQIREKKKTKLWIISRDGDYGTTYGGKGFLNAFLLKELQEISPQIEVFLFEDTITGIRHFVEVTGVEADSLPTQQETKEIEMEEKSLPPPDSVPGKSDLKSLEAFRLWLIKEGKMPPVPPATTQKMAMEVEQNFWHWLWDRYQGHLRASEAEPKA